MDARVSPYLALVVIVALALVALLIVRFQYARGKAAALKPPFTVAERPRALAPSPRALLLIGDSRIARWQPLPDITGLRVVNRGVGGETTQGLAARFDTERLALEPGFILIQSGINDLIAASFMETADARAVMARATANLKRVAMDGAAAGATVILTTVIPPGDAGFPRILLWSESVRRLVSAMNADLRAWSRPDRVLLLDMGEILNPGERLESRFCQGTLHLSEATYRTTNAALRKLLTEPSRSGLRSRDSIPSPLLQPDQLHFRRTSGSGPASVPDRASLRRFFDLEDGTTAES